MYNSLDIVVLHSCEYMWGLSSTSHLTNEGRLFFFICVSPGGAVLVLCPHHSTCLNWHGYYSLRLRPPLPSLKFFNDRIMSQRSSNKRNSKNSTHDKIVTQDFVFLGSANTSTTAKAVVLNLTAAALATASTALTNFLDTYRYWRLEHVAVQTEVSAQDAGAYPYVLAYQPSGSSAFSGFSDVEVLQSTAIHPTNAANPLSVAVLKLARPDFEQISKKQWLLTQDDATDPLLDNYGAVYAVLGGAATTGQVFYYKARLRISFRTILDPGTISLNMARRVYSNSAFPVYRPMLPQRPTNQEDCLPPFNSGSSRRRPDG